MHVPRFVLAGSSSGVGKTSVSCGLIHALRRSGHTVQPFKVGPDYIDPGHLSLVSGNACRNLDVWLMGRRRVLESFVENSCSDVSLVEGVMGYFDGSSGDSNHSSTHHVASILGAPVVLVLDASRTARSIAATALGFVKFHRNSRIRGIILNKLAGPRHERLCRQALAQLGIPILACIPKDGDLSLESRHLGLIPAAESGPRSRAVLRAARIISDLVDTEALLRICSTGPELIRPQAQRRAAPRATVCVALDSSFNFYYQDNLEALRRAGARLEFFSPADDAALPECDGLYIGGGFPEVRAARLARNGGVRSSVRRFAERGGPVYAECGGLMYLADSITYGRRRHPMVGLVPGEVAMTEKMRLNYTRASVSRDCLVAPRLKKFQGHEFHYSEFRSLAADSRFAYDMRTGYGIRDGKDGLVIHNTLASYGHLYFDPGNASRLVGACVRASRR